MFNTIHPPAPPTEICTTSDCAFIAIVCVAEGLTTTTPEREQMVTILPSHSVTSQPNPFNCPHNPADRPLIIRVTELMMLLDTKARKLPSLSLMVDDKNEREYRE